MLDRRKFTFGMLLGAAASASTAASANPEQKAPQAERFRARYAATSAGKTVEITLALVNLSSEPVSVVSRRGSQPGAGLSVARVGAPDGEQLAPIINVDRKELVSRIGPRPIFETLAAGAEMSFGPYQFASPEGAPEEIVISSWVEVAPYETVEIPPQTIRLSGKRSAS